MQQKKQEDVENGIEENIEDAHQHAI